MAFRARVIGAGLLLVQALPGLGELANAFGLGGEAASVIADGTAAARASDGLITDAGADTDAGAAGGARDDPGCIGGSSFTAGTLVLLATGKTAPISQLKPGAKVLATSTKTGKTSPEAVTAVLAHHDTNLYDLTIQTSTGTQLIHTTSNHLFWDPIRHQWIPANKLSKGEHLKAPDGQVVTADGGTTPKVHDGWMWDLTVPGNNDHDFYVLPSGNDGNHAAHAVAGDTPILVHNACGDVYGPGSPGPLPEKVAETFTGGTYTETVTSGVTRLYRVYGGTAGKFGGYWSRTLPSSGAQAIRDSALDPAWGNTGEHRVSIDVPDGTTLYEGTAAAQGSLPGGGSQVLIQGGPVPAWESGGGSLP